MHQPLLMTISRPFHQRAGLVNYHTRERFLAELTLQQEDALANDEDPIGEQQLLTASIEASVADLSDVASTVDNGTPSIDSGPRKEAYVAIVPSKVQFYSCVKMVSSGLSSGKHRE